MATATEAVAAVDEVVEEAKTRKGRTEQFDWAAAKGVEDKSLVEGHEKLIEWWDYQTAASRSKDTPAAKQLAENFFCNKVEYHKWRQTFWEWRLAEKLREVEASSTAIKDRIAESVTFLSTCEKLGPEVAEQVAKADKLRKQYEDAMAKLTESGYVADDLEEEDLE